MCRLPGGLNPLAADAGISGAMHSLMAGDIHVSLARTLSRAVSAKAATAPPLDATHVALLENLEEGDEDGSQPAGDDDPRRPGKRVSTSH